MFRLLDVEDDFRVVGRCKVVPVCGVDFCDVCGCCLDCFNECPCCPQAVVYSDNLQEWMYSHGFTYNPFAPTGEPDRTGGAPSESAGG